MTKNFKFNIIIAYSVLLVCLSLVSINCMGTIGMRSGYGSNINEQPGWGPTTYDRVTYYYIPDIDAYYSVEDHQYIYRDGTNWRHAATLPSSYNGYDPYNSYKVVVNTDQPYRDNDNHRIKYGKYKGVKSQEMIRDSHEEKYFENKDNPEHTNWVKRRQH